MSYDATSTAPPLPTASPPLQGGEKAHALAFTPSPSQGKGWDGVANANSTSSACGISSFARRREGTCFSFCSFPFSRGRLGWGCCCGVRLLPHNADSTSSACGISSFARRRESTCFSFCSFPFSRGRLGWGCCCSHDVNLTRWNMITA
jgi:hypothetical protein